jgi:hypothetical protein
VPPFNKLRDRDLKKTVRGYTRGNREELTEWEMAALKALETYARTISHVQIRVGAKPNIGIFPKFSLEG